MKLIPKRSKQFEVLRNLFLFQHVKVEAAENVFLSPICECFEFEAREMIYSRTNFRKCMGIVVSGEVRAVKQGKEGNLILLNSFTPGGIFGLAAVFHESGEYVSEVQAVRRSRVLFLPEELLRSLFRREPMTAENYIAYLTNRICFLNHRIDIFTGGSAEQRLAGFLVSVCPKESPFVYRVPFTFIELAEILNIGRASLYRAMVSSQVSWVVVRNSNDLVIVDPEILKRFE